MTEQPDEPQPLTRDDLKRMKPAEVMTALRAGDLNHLTGGPAKPPAEGQLDRSHLKAMTATEIEIAQKPRATITARKIKEEVMQSPLAQLNGLTNRAQP